MRKFHIAMLATPLLLAAGVAGADQVEGVVQKVDPGSNTVTVNNLPYQFENGVAGLKLSQIKVGDKVRLQYDVNTNNVYQADPAK